MGKCHVASRDCTGFLLRTRYQIARGVTEQASCKTSPRARSRQWPPCNANRSYRPARATVLSSFGIHDVGLVAHRLHHGIGMVSDVIGRQGARRQHSARLLEVRPDIGLNCNQVDVALGGVAFLEQVGNGLDLP